MQFLCDENFITEEVQDDILNPRSMLSEHQKAGVIVTAIRNRISLSPQYYHILTEYLHQRTFYECIANILDQEYRRLAQMTGIDDCTYILAHGKIVTTHH